MPVLPEVVVRVRREDVDLAVRVRTGRGPGLVLVHGWGSDSSVWDPFLDAAGPVPATRVDLRGHGGSSRARTPHTIQAMAADLLGVVEELDLPPAVLIGHSMGANVAAAAVLTDPTRFRGLVAVDPAWADPGDADVPRRSADLARRGGAAAAAEVAQAFDRRADPGRVADVAATLRGTDRVVLRESLHSTYTDPGAFGRLPETRRVLAQLRRPLLSVLPDRTRAARALRLPVTDHTVVELEGCGHFVPLERPEELWSVVSAWLAGPVQGATDIRSDA